MMANLSPEIWIMIFEEVYGIEPYDPYCFVPPLQRLRLVSRWFNVIVTPYLYRQRYLRARDLADPDDPRSAQELSNIRAFTKELVMPDYHEMNYSLLAPAAEHISACRVLECLKWHTSSPAATRRTGSASTIVLGAVLSKSVRNARVEISQNWFTISPHVEPKSLGFIARSEESSSLYRQPTLSSATLDLLDIETRSYFPMLTPSSTRLPPMKMLILRSYSWLHTESQVPLIWDFSLLQYLRLFNVFLSHFLTSIPPSQFRNLRCLDLEPRISDYLDGGNESKEPLVKLFRAAVSLEELAITGSWRNVFTISSLSCLPNLRILRIRTRHGGALSSDQSFYGLKVDEIKEIQASCRRLVGIEFDLEFVGDEHLQTLTLFSTFPNLQRLHINATHQLPPPSHLPIKIQLPGTDPLKLTQILSHLQTSKLGTPFTRIDISLDIQRDGPESPHGSPVDEGRLSIPGTFPSGPDSEDEYEQREALRKWFGFFDKEGEQVLWSGDRELDQLA